MISGGVELIRLMSGSYLPIKMVLFALRTCAYQGVRNNRFSENLTCFVFLKHPFWDSPFFLITGEYNTGHNYINT